MTHDRRRSHPSATGSFERRLIAAAANGDRAAQHRLLERYEPLVRRLVRGWYLPWGDRDDLAQTARLAVMTAACAWDPRRGVPFRSFAATVITRELKDALQSSRAAKHAVLTGADRLDRPVRVLASDADNHGEPFLTAGDFAIVGSADDDPLTRVLARERLRAIVARVGTLSPLERRALALWANDHSHREIADALGVRTRGVNNALQRVRRKLLADARP